VFDADDGHAVATRQPLDFIDRRGIKAAHLVRRPFPDRDRYQAAGLRQRDELPERPRAFVRRHMHPDGAEEHDVGGQSEGQRRR
jgi:hypothetical protein